MGGASLRTVKFSRLEPFVFSRLEPSNLHTSLIVNKRCGFMPINRDKSDMHAYNNEVICDDSKKAKHC